MLLLGINKGLRGSRPEIAILFELQELLQQDDCGTVGAPVLPCRMVGRIKALYVVEGIPRRVQSHVALPARVSAWHMGRFGVPVDADAAKADRLCDDAKRDRVDGAVEGAPVCRKAIQVLTGSAACTALLALWVMQR